MKRKTNPEKMKIISIGGGKLALRQTLPIDRFVVSLARRKRPRALFIPTASGDDAEYCEIFDRIYGGKLNCQVDCLKLLGRNGERKHLAKRILAADLIYVGGGNTMRMMKLWRKIGVDKLLRRAGRQGTVLTGLSAGAICWHRWGHSDSMSFSADDRQWSHIRVRSLDFIPHLYCPHLDGEKRHDSLVAMLRRGEMAVACDNNAAIFYGPHGARCLTSRKRARTHVYRKSREGVSVTSYQDGETIDL